MTAKELAEAARAHTRCDGGIRTYDGRHRIRCKQKDPGKCHGCSTIHRRHTKIIIWSGINKNRELSTQNVEIDGNHSFYFVTLTAPSFGSVHKLDKHSSNPTKCACGITHDAKDPYVSTPIDTSRYRYREQVLWNVWSNDLYKRTQEKLRKVLPGAEMCSIREPQKRGVVHYHVLVRVPATVPQKEAIKALKGMRKHSITRMGNKYEWGRQVDVKRVKTDGDDLQKTVSYISKLVGYTTKSLGITENVFSKPAMKFAKKLREVGATVKCHRRDCEGSECTSEAHTELGFHGQEFTQTDGWSFFGYTYKSLREEMKAYAEAQAAGSDDPDAYQKALQRDFNHYPQIAKLEMEDAIGEANLHKVYEARKASAERMLNSWL